MDRYHVQALQDYTSRYHDRDHFSRLTNDCFLDIFARLDHIDLDNICVLSRRMCKLPELARSKAIKLEASQLIATQINEFKFHFELEYAEKCYDMKFSAIDSELPGDKYCDSEIEIRQPITTRGNTGEAVHLLTRFNFQKFEFKSICVDKNFIAMLEQVASTSIFASFHLVTSGFDENLSVTRKQRFMAKLLSAKPKSAHLNLGHEEFLNADFINYCNNSAAPLSELINFNRKSPLIIADGQSVMSLAELRSLSTNALIVDTDWLTTALIKRFRCKTEGTWEFRVTKVMTHIQIERALDWDLEYDRKKGRISMSGSIHKSSTCSHPIFQLPLLTEDAEQQRDNDRRHSHRHLASSATRATIIQELEEKKKKRNRKKDSASSDHCHLANFGTNVKC